MRKDKLSRKTLLWNRRLADLIGSMKMYVATDQEKVLKLILNLLYVYPSTDNVMLIRSLFGLIIFALRKKHLCFVQKLIPFVYDIRNRYYGQKEFTCDINIYDYFIATGYVMYPLRNKIFVDHEIDMYHYAPNEANLLGELISSALEHYVEEGGEFKK